MKFLVEVNAKYLVSVEAETALRAEHIVLEYDGIWGAMAFDQDMMKTETFAGVVMSCETKSMNEIEMLSDAYREANIRKAKAVDAQKAADDEVKRIEEMLKLAKENSRIALQNVYTANKDVAQANEDIGFRTNY